jgi:hypothetical protein
MTYKVQILIALSTIGLMFTTCENYDETDCFTACSQQVIIDAEEYQNAPDDELEILNIQLEGDCLAIRFESGGCDGNSWGIKLIDSEDIMESNPPQRNLRLSLKNQEPCDAIVTKEIAFNISNLRLEYNKIILNITNSGDQVLYEY